MGLGTHNPSSIGTVEFNLAASSGRMATPFRLWGLHSRPSSGRLNDVAARFLESVSCDDVRPEV
jgi:hypothetical protein